MATEKVGVYRKYHGPVPTDPNGHPLPKREWPDKRPFRWAARWFGIDGKRYSESFKTRKEAERFAEAKQAEVRQGKADRPKRISLREFYWEHKKLMKGAVAAKTLRMQLATLAHLAKSVGWDRDLMRIAPRAIEQFRAARAADNAPATVNKEVRILRRLFNLAIGRGYVASGTNPCLNVPMAKVGRKRIPYCSPKEFEAIYRHASEPFWRTLLVMIYGTGLRLREAMNLTWSDIDFEQGQVHITRKQAEGFVQAWTPKDHELRVLPLPKQAIDLLAQWQGQAPEKCPYVFMESGRWEYYRQEVESGTWTPHRDLVNNLLRRFQTLCRKAGVRKYTIHDLRRSCITNWARNLPIHVTQQLAGHSDIHTTQAYYLAVESEDIAKAKRVQTGLMAGIERIEPTDPKVTHSGQKRHFPQRKLFRGMPQPPEI